MSYLTEAESYQNSLLRSLYFQIIVSHIALSCWDIQDMSIICFVAIHK